MRRSNITMLQGQSDADQAFPLDAQIEFLRPSPAAGARLPGLWGVHRMLRHSTA